MEGSMEDRGPALPGGRKVSQEDPPGGCPPAPSLRNSPDTVFPQDGQVHHILPQHTVKLSNPGGSHSEEWTATSPASKFFSSTHNIFLLSFLLILFFSSKTVLNPELWYTHLNLCLPAMVGRQEGWWWWWWLWFQPANLVQQEPVR